MQTIHGKKFPDCMSYKNIGKQLRAKGDHFFHIKEMQGYKKETSPDHICCFIMSNPKGKFQIFRFNSFLIEVEKIKEDCPSKENALHWLNSNRERLRYKI